MQPVTEELQHELGRLFAHLGRQIRPGELGSAGHAVLGHLCRVGAMRAHELAAAEGMDASTMSRRLAQMAERGLVERVPDPKDGRAWLVGVTDAGIDAFRAERARRVTLVTDRVADWNPPDVAELARLISRLNVAFDSVDKGAAK